MLVSEDEFSNELNIFRNEVDAGISFFYGWLTLDDVAKNQTILNNLNIAPHFWNAIKDALLIATLIRLGRIFDSDAKAHSVHRLMRMTQQNMSLFSLSALAQRKAFLNQQDLANYLANAYAPTIKDIRALGNFIRNKQKIYRDKYSDLRNKLFAHKEVLDNEVKSQLLKNTNIRELQLLLISLRQVHDALSELLNNGRKPVLKPQRYSVQQIRRKPRPDFQIQTVQEHLIREIEEFFKLTL